MIKTICKLPEALVEKSNKNKIRITLFYFTFFIFYHEKTYFVEYTWY